MDEISDYFPNQLITKVIEVYQKRHEKIEGWHPRKWGFSAMRYRGGKYGYLDMTMNNTS